MQMAKKRTSPLEAGKARLELRVDQDVYDGIVALAMSVGVSVNQLAQGVLRWAANNANLGEVQQDETGDLSTREQDGCVWFGREAGDCREEDGSIGHDRGECAFALDFTERRVVRELVTRVSKREKGGRHGKGSK
jgi:hypothetical protein